LPGFRDIRAFVRRKSFLAEHHGGRVYATVLRPAVVVCDVMYCG